ncbi:hypothetical protein DUNSADRAFT_8746 [Dunaliella salina]|uniref:Uncharacterized protein n=1 Tax=Dunaliella salina TaxID=3046 RepID=A0ABQ7GIU9_DUNSA|nr:hypothetical protein DUNSADRAFT_8746 [Dunaliella salina]|eukprot:KAF5834538.1 hypothetical protein DUNSADRAFT_8746 [Dunaliella salina]
MKQEAQAGGLQDQQQQEQQLQGPGQSACAHAHVSLRGAERRRAKWPQLVVPSLRDLSLDLGQQQQRFPQAQETWPSAMAHDSYSSVHAQGASASFGAIGEASAADLGPSLCTLTRLQCRLQADPLALEPILDAMVAQAMPALQDLELHVTRPSLLHPASLLSTHSDALNQCAGSGVLQGLRSLRLTAAWDGLVPEGFTDYTTRGALGGKPGALQPSGMLPKKHLGFLAKAPLLLPSLTHLHLTTDRFRIDLCPPSLTCLVLEGVVRLDPLTLPSPPAPPAPEISHTETPAPRPHALQPAAQLQTNHPPVQDPPNNGHPPHGHDDSQPWNLAAPPLITPCLQKLCVVLARHPREPLPPQAAAPNSGLQGQTPPLPAAGLPTPSAEQQQPTAAPVTTPSQPQLPSLSPSQHPHQIHHTLQPQQQRQQQQQHVPVQRVSQYCVLDVLAPLMGPALTQLSYTATPSPQLSCLTCITELVTGNLDNEAYTGRLSLGHMDAQQRHCALAWATGLVEQRFGTLPSPAVHQPSPRLQPASSAQPHSTCAPASAGNTAAAAASMDTAGAPCTAAAAGAAAAAFLAGAAVEEEGASALQGSDDDVDSDDLLYESGEEEDEESGGDVLGAWDDED